MYIDIFSLETIQPRPHELTSIDKARISLDDGPLFSEYLRRWSDDSIKGVTRGQVMRNICILRKLRYWEILLNVQYISNE